MIKPVFYTFCVTAVMCFGACVPESQPRLNKALRTQVDTLYKAQVVALREELDSICVVETDKIIASAVDSIITLRKQERLEKLGY